MVAITRLVSPCMCLVLAAPAWAQVTVDGTRDAPYGAPLAVQTVETQFGDANPAGGSELDAGYAVVWNSRLYFLLTGNLEQNYNNLEVFIDSTPGGENILSGTPVYDGGESSKFAGMTFDTGFEADYHLFAYWGAVSIPAFAFQTDFVARLGGVVADPPRSWGQTGAPVGLQAAGAIAAGLAGMTSGASSPALTQTLEIAINNNNTAGVIAGTNAADATAAAAVTTGMEFSIALADLGNPGPGATIKIFAAINNSGHDYLSNQILGGLPAGTGNLGGNGSGGFNGTVSEIDLNSAVYAQGTQFFTLQLPQDLSQQPVPVLTGWGTAFLALVIAALAWVALAGRRG